MVVVAFGQDPADVEFSNRLRVIKLNNVNYGNFEGSPYIQENYEPAKISVADRIYSLRYNAFEDRMEMLSDGVEKALPMLDNLTIKFINLKKVYKIFKDPKGKQGYFVLVYVGEKGSLVTKESVVFQEEANPQSGYDQYKPAMFKREKDQFYWAEENGTTSVLSSKKKEFYAMFGRHSYAVKNYVKKNKLNIKKEEDLVQLFVYFDSL